MHFTKTKDGGRRHLEFRKSVATSLLVDQSSPNLMGMLRTWPQTQMSYQKCIFNKNQGGGNNATSDLKIELMINGTERIQRNA